MEAVQQYEMLAIEATLISAEADVQVEHITGVSWNLLVIFTNAFNLSIVIILFM